MLFYLETWQAWLIACILGFILCYSGFASYKALTLVDKIDRLRKGNKRLKAERDELKIQIATVKAVGNMSYPELTKEEFEMLLLFKGKTRAEQDQMLAEMERDK